MNRKLHPIIQAIIHICDDIVDSAIFRRLVGIAAHELIQIFGWLLVLTSVHILVTALFIISLWTVMPGHRASKKLSDIIRISITSSNLLKGTITLPELADYWIDGPRSPAHKVIRTSETVELIAEVLLVACSIFFTWESMKTKVIQGECTATSYPINSTLPDNISLQQYLEGDSDFASVYNYGLPLQDGIIGGWGVACDHGTPREDITQYGEYAAGVTGFISSIDEQGFMLELDVIVPPRSIVDDRTGKLQNTTFLQHCSVFFNVATANMEFRFTADETDTVAGGQMTQLSDVNGEIHLANPGSRKVYFKEVYKVFGTNDSLLTGDMAGVYDLVLSAVTETTLNATYYPSKEGKISNFLWWAAGPDGFYHTRRMYRGLAAGIASAHFSLMQYDGGADAVPCLYYSQMGAGKLIIPDLAVIVATVGSCLAVAVKLFEILWWFLMRVTSNMNGYKKVRRSLRHPVRFAMDMAQTFAETLADYDEDVCDVTTEAAISAFGHSRLMYGEDIETNEDERGHLRIGPAGKITSVKEGRQYGTFRESNRPELDEFFWL
ncbi:UNVERIFIED_CONTAM: hypothetical protein HDU68_007249 [Siphonaria sp. JEL0065]|nr:hypothetical protein HDU68_007249 [Siphonaria sp. JEL0065]